MVLLVSSIHFPAWSWIAWLEYVDMPEYYSSDSPSTIRR